MTIHLSILVPVFNEQESLGAFLEAIQAPLEQALALIAPDAQAELLFVDDGSTDRTPDMLAILCGLDSRVRSMRLSRNFGKEAALAAGLHHARGLAVVPMDVDLQDPPEVLPRLVREWCNGARVVNAKRVDRSCDGVFKRWSANGFYRLFNILSEMELPENVGDFRLLDRVAVDVMNRLGERSRFSKGLFAWVGFKVATVEYTRARAKPGAPNGRCAACGALLSTASPPAPPPLAHLDLCGQHHRDGRLRLCRLPDPAR
jgi:glycosyltransferase involved in cell wall biosynthesis